MDLTDFVSPNGDHPVTDSRKVAKHFEKQHAKVLRSIRQLLAETGEWGRANFGECFEINGLANGKPEPLYRISKDGFMLLVMGFTGKKALGMKLKFIEAFNAMAEFLRSGLWQRRQDAEAAFAAGKAQASLDGSGLCRWRYRKREHERLIEELDRQMKLPFQPT